MLKFGNKEFRNLQEQVLKNMDDIENLLQGTVVLDEFGIKVVGQVDTEEDLPESAEEYGDAYAVGTESPYELYIWTRNIDEGEDGWFNIGQFPKPGPEGPQGEDGPQGEPGVFNEATASVDNATGTPYVVVTSNAEEGTVDFAFHNLRGQDGADGQQGPRGYDGEQGPQGPKGDDGVIQYYTGSGISIEQDAQTERYIISALVDEETIDFNEDGQLTVIGGGTGVVESVNGQTGVVVLDAGDILATNTQSVQANLERIDLEVEGLVDDIADLNTGKLNASKSAVSSVGGLVVPTVTPVSEQLVGIDTSGSQEAVTIGNNLTLINGVLSATGGSEVTPEAILEVVEGSASVTVDLNETDDKVQIKLDQDILDEIDGKQDILTAGTGIDITNNEISIDEDYTATISYVDEKIGDIETALSIIIGGN